MLKSNIFLVAVLLTLTVKVAAVEEETPYVIKVRYPMKDECDRRCSKYYYLRKQNCSTSRNRFRRFTYMYAQLAINCEYWKAYKNCYRSCYKSRQAKLQFHKV